MKKRLKYIIFILLIFTQYSCNDWLELEPPTGLIREEFWKTKEDVQAVLMASYAEFATMNRKLFVLGEVRADMLRGLYGQPENERLLMENNIYSENELTNWSDFYRVIDYCNEVIVNAPKVQEIDNTFTDYQRQGFVAEAYFLRSLVYFYLVRIYKDVPLVLQPTESDDADVFLPKSTDKEILDHIIKDLETNRAYAPSYSFPTKEQNKGRASKASYDALLADISLWRFDYESVITYVERIENNEKIVLLPTNKWFELYYPGNSLEGLFELQFDSKLQQSNSLAGLTSQYSYQYVPSQKAVEMFSFKYSTELVRGEDATIKRYGENDYVIWKYVGQAPDGQTTRSGDEYGSCNLIIYRLADLLLMKAEALSQMGEYNKAFEIISVIRDRAGIPNTMIGNSPIAYEDAILQERALELAYEGKRWFDLLRMGRRNNYARKENLIEIIVSNVPSIQKRILATKLTNPLGWYLPIYEGEIERNTKLIQNPYYKTIK